MSSPWQPPAPSLASLPVDRSKTEPKPAYYKLQFGDDVTGFSYYVRTLAVVIGRNCERHGQLPAASPAPALAEFADGIFGMAIDSAEAGLTPPIVLESHIATPPTTGLSGSITTPPADVLELDADEIAALASLEGPGPSPSGPSDAMDAEDQAEPVEGTPDNANDNVKDDDDPTGTNDAESRARSTATPDGDQKPQDSELEDAISKYDPFSVDIKPDLESLAGLDAFELPPPPPPMPIKSELHLDHVDVDLGPLKSVSRNHAKIEYRTDIGQFCLEIFGRNGAWVDDRYYVKGTVVPLNQGSQIQIATRIFSFILPPSPEGSPSYTGEIADGTIPYETLPYPYNLPPEQVGYAEFFGEAGPGPSTIAAQVPAFNAFAASDGYGIGDTMGFADQEWIDEWESGGDDESSDSEYDDEPKRPVIRLTTSRPAEEESDLSSLSEPEPEPRRKPKKKSEKPPEVKVEPAEPDPKPKLGGKGAKSPAAALAMKQPGKNKIKSEDAMDVDESSRAGTDEPSPAPQTPRKKKEDRPKKEKKKKVPAPVSTITQNPPAVPPRPASPPTLAAAVADLPAPQRPPLPQTLAQAQVLPSVPQTLAQVPSQPVRPAVRPPLPGPGVRPPGPPGQMAPGPVRPPVRAPLALPPGAVRPPNAMQARPPGAPGLNTGQLPPGMVRPPMAAVRPGMPIPARPPQPRPPPPPPRQPPPPAEPPRPYYISELKENPARKGHLLCSVPIPPSGAGPRQPPAQILGLDGKPFIGPGPLKPTATFATIIHRALTNLPRGRGTLGEVCNWVAGEWEWFRLNPEAGWQNSIRHNLSLNKAFLKVPRIPEDDPESKGSVWILDPEEGPLFEEKQRRDALKNEGKAKNAEEKRMRERMKAEERARKQREREHQIVEARGVVRPLPVGVSSPGVRPVRPPVQSANRGVLSAKGKITVVIQPVTPALRAKSVIDKTDANGLPLPFVCDGTTLFLDQQTFGHLTSDIVDKLQQLGAAVAVDVLSAWVVNKNKQTAQRAVAARAAGVATGVRPAVRPGAPGTPTVRPVAPTPARPAAPIRPPPAAKPLPGPAPPGANLTKVISMIAEVANARGDVNTVGPNAGALLRYIRHVGVDIDLRVAERIWATGVVPPLPPKKPVAANGRQPARPPAAGTTAAPARPPANGANGTKAVPPTPDSGAALVNKPTSPPTASPTAPTTTSAAAVPAPKPASVVAPATAPAPAPPATAAPVADIASLKRKLEETPVLPNGAGAPSLSSTGGEPEAKKAKVSP